MTSDFISFSLFMVSLGIFSFGAIIVTSIICEKHRVFKSESIRVIKEDDEEE